MIDSYAESCKPESVCVNAHSDHMKTDHSVQWKYRITSIVLLLYHELQQLECEHDRQSRTLLDTVDQRDYHAESLH